MRPWNARLCTCLGQKSCFKRLLTPLIDCKTGPSTASIGKNLSNLSPHQPATGLGGSILTSIIDALKVRICRAGFWLKKAKIRKKVLSSSLLKQYQYLDQPKKLPKFLFQLRELMLEIKSVSTESFFINYLYNNSKTTEQIVLRIYSL